MRKDVGAWSLPKGEIEPGEAQVDVARREFREELGQDPPEGPMIALGSIRQAGGKVVHAWARSKTTSPSTTSRAPSSA